MYWGGRNKEEAADHNFSFLHYSVPCWEYESFRKELLSLSVPEIHLWGEDET